MRSRYFIFFLLPLFLGFLPCSEESAATFIFTYDGPDTIFVGQNCLGELEWGHPDNPTVEVSSGIVLFWELDNISGGYSIGDSVPAGVQVEVTYYARDNQANEEYFTFTIDFIDTISPIWVTSTLPPDTTIFCYNTLPQWAPMAIDNCQDTLLPHQITSNFNPPDLVCSDTVIEILWMATDSFGNVSTYSQEINLIADTTTPGFAMFPNDTLMYCPDSLRYHEWIQSQIDKITIVDTLCGDSVAYFAIHPPYSVLKDTCGPLQIDFYVLDLCGNSDMTTAFFTRLDTFPPQIIQPPVQPQLMCGLIPLEDQWISWKDSMGGMEVIDSCSSFEVRIPEYNPDEYSNCDDSVWINFEVEDACGNIRIDSIISILKDTSAPELLQSFKDSLHNCSSAPTQDVFENWLNYNLDIMASDHCTPDSQILREIYFEDSLRTRQEILDLFNQRYYSGCLDSVEYEGVFLYDIRVDFKLEFVFVDKCMNETSGMARFLARDNYAPILTIHAQDITIECKDSLSIRNDITKWLGKGGNSDFGDDCDSVEVLASPDMNSILQTVFQNLQNLCNESVVVDVTFYGKDLCGNFSVDSTMATLTVLDRKPPIFNQCTSDTLVLSLDDTCTATWNLEYPTVFDSCGLESQTFSSLEIRPISSPMPGDAFVPVSGLQVDFDFTSGLSELPAIGDPSLDIELLQIDAEHPEEYFYVISEDGDTLGTTSASDSQCGNSIALFELQLDKLNTWLSDSVVTFYLSPNIPVSLDGRFAINDICGGSELGATLSWLWPVEQDIPIFVSFDYGDTLPIDLAPQQYSLSSGDYLVEYFAEDCSGNIGTCQRVLSARDLTPPEMSCPEADTLYLSGDSCSMEFQLPLPEFLNDNCGFATESIHAWNGGAWYLQFETDPNTGGLVAQDFLAVFRDMPSGVFNSVTFDFNHIWDAEPASNAFFRIKGEDGTLLGITDTVQTSCNQASSTKLVISSDVINPYLDDNILVLVFEANSDYGMGSGSPDDGINPCNLPLFPDQSDSTSQIWGFVEFTPALVEWSVSGATEYPPSQDYFNGVDPTIRLNGGINSIHYSITDGAGLSSSCSYEVVVRDTTAPIARCRQSTFYIDPGDQDISYLDPQLINDLSEDECMIDSMLTSPAFFTCSDVGSVQLVELTVLDGQGNSSKCQTIVEIESAPVMPGFLLDICEPDTLALFANPPTSSIGQLTFSWVGPMTFTSDDENPILTAVTPANSGEYVVMIEGANGCISTGSINVQIESSVTPIISPPSSLVCSDQPIQIQATPFEGNVTYDWYSGIPPGGVFLGSTSTPVFNDTLPVGQYTIYTIVRQDVCNSQPSAPVDVQVLDKPPSNVSPEFEVLCEGDDLILSTTVQGPDLTFEWNGPNGYFSTQRIPPVVENISMIEAGEYTLEVSLGDCVSDLAQSIVQVLERPITPILVGPDFVCEGDDIVLTVNNIVDGDKYIWHHPNGSQISTQENTLTLNNVETDLSGFWTVEVEDVGCRSLPSEPKEVIVDAQPDITVDNDGPVCMGDSVTLLVDSIEGASYHWTGPTQFMSNEINPKISAKTGIYNVEVSTRGGCMASGNTIVLVRTVPMITGLTNDGLGCVDAAADVCFTYTVEPPDDGTYTYMWSGPHGFMSFDSSLCIYGATEEDNGIYSLIINAGGCVSDEATTLLELTNILFEPEIEGPNALCTGDSLLLTTNFVGGIGIEYHWMTPNGLEITQDSFLQIASVTILDEGEYSVFLQNESCTTSMSEPYEVTINPIPPDPIIDGATTYCEGDTLVLRSRFSAQSYVWTDPKGMTYQTRNIIVPDLDTGQAGTYSLVLIDEICASENSDEVDVRIIERPDSPNSFAPTDSFCVDGSPLFLCIEESSQKPGLSYAFYNAFDANPISDTSLATCLDVDPNLMLNDGPFQFFAVSFREGCASETGIPSTIDLTIQPVEMADAGDDITLCDDPFGKMAAILPLDGNGEWIFDQEQLNIQNAFDPESNFELIGEFQTTAIWSLSKGYCRDYSSDEVNIMNIPAPIAFDDSLELGINEQGQLDLLANDIFTGQINLELTNEPMYGEAVITQDGMFSYIPDEGFVGVDLVRYTLCETNCPDLCDDALIQITVGNLSDCNVPTIFTPNEDGINDKFVIPCLGTGGFMEQTTVNIFNSNGDEVFSAYGYQNDWDGTYKGEPLPEGTYFYIVDFGGVNTIEKGFLELKR